jgi:hypothetical protein
MYTRQPFPRFTGTAALACLAALATLAVHPARAQVKMVEFSELGTGTVAANGVKSPAGATVLRQVSAPLNQAGDSVLLNIYKRNGEVFVDALTGKAGQPGVLKNHVRIKSPSPIRPEKMTVTMRWLQADYRSGVLIIASDDSGSLLLAFPKGFGGPAYQQQFLAASAAGVRRTYDFSTNDSRGFAIVKASVESSGTVTPPKDYLFYVWGGKQFVPRKPN